MTAMSRSSTLAIFSCIVVLVFNSGGPAMAAEGDLSRKERVKVGLLVDSNATMGRIASSYINTALSDFYEAHPSYRTRLSLHFRNPQNDVVLAASAALDLMQNEEVHAIIGPEWSSQAKFVIDLGIKAQVPIISFSATSPSLSPTQSRYFVRTAYDDCSQVEAIAALIQAFGWREIVPIYEDTDYGNGLIPYLTDAFQNIDTRVPYRSAIHPTAQDIDILKELNKVMTMSTRVFLVHMTATLGSRLFVLANEAGMLNEESVWIVTDGLSSLLDPVGSTAMSSMQGVVGVRPYVPMSKRLKKFMEKQLNISHGISPTSGSETVNLFTLWAYDTIWALAMVAEKQWTSSDQLRYVRPSKNRKMAALNFSDTGISEMGPKLLQGIINLSFYGLSGLFEMVHGQLQPSGFEIINVLGNEEKIIGYWTPKHGLSKTLSNRTEENREYYSTSVDDLEPVLWPGKTPKEPKGWVMPTLKDTKMKIAVPVKTGFSEFFKIHWDQRTGVPSYSGFSYDMFIAVVDALPFYIPYEFVPFMNASRQSAGTYDEMLYQIKLQKVDIVVGDITVVANRSNYVDFTLPYSESGVSMVVAIKDDERRNMWIFLRPLSWDLWLTIGLSFVLTGLIVYFLEGRHQNEDFGGSRSEQLSTSLWFSFSTLVFAHREKVVNNRTRLVLAVWIFLLLIITQSYTASLASLLTVERLQPQYVDVQELVRKHHHVGYQKGSYVRELLVRDLGFYESRLVPLNSAEEYHEALSNGIGNGGVAAIFAETPYIKLFLGKYCNEYMMVGPTYKNDGFGFAFPRGSPLVSYFSRAILNVTQDKTKMNEIESKNHLWRSSSCQDEESNQGGATISSRNLSLGVGSFSGLFIITGIVAVLAVLAELVKGFRTKFSLRKGIDRKNSKVVPLTSIGQGDPNTSPANTTLSAA
ncbi:glutamate receptor 2.1-like isoform X1 [Punica granatum]|uniref:Glutamate receptor n=2 Tax=Punica granatum TaxID=22663 RepID=A0A6P8D147_PUNGR|nr:glutamate receptor 2.1-like isoform X1 [Punica granatum]